MQVLCSILTSIGISSQLLLACGYQGPHGWSNRRNEATRAELAVGWRGVVGGVSWD